MRRALAFLLPALAVACATSAVTIISGVPDGGADSGVDGGSDGSACPQFDLTNDPKHCGSCTNACSTGQVCSLGKCKAQCDPPTTTCQGDAGPICATLDSDPKRCGSCTNACELADAGGLQPGTGNPDAGIPFDGGYDAGSGWSLGTPSCAKGACGVTCPGSMTVCSDRICYDTQNHHDHCGDCSTACQVAEWCNGGRCCATGKLNCNGTCTDVLSDTNNCGSCGNKCTGNLTCGGGQCVACSSLAGPASFTNNIGGWPTSGLRFKALKNTTLTGFTFNNQGTADTVQLTSTTGTVLQSLSTPASTPTYVATVSWPLVAGTSYNIVNLSGTNGRWVAFSSYPVANGSIQIDAMVNSSQTLSTQYWFTFTNMQTCP